MIVSEPKRRTRNPTATRDALLAAARTLIARDGPENLSLSAAAQLAGVSRGTAYQRFADREALIAATLQSVSDQLLEAAFVDPQVPSGNVSEGDIVGLITTLADFAVDNPELCRIWFLQLLASEHPDEDRFVHHYLESFRAFTATDHAVEGVDSEIVSLMVLSANFLWPVWSKAAEKSEAERRQLARRFADEVLRFSLYGSMRPEFHPQIGEKLRPLKASSTPPVAAGR